MRSVVFTLIALICSSTYGIDLVGHRMSNRGGHCTWACLETAGRANGIKELEGLLEKKEALGHFQPGYMPTVKQTLDSLHVKNICQKDGAYNRDTLKQYAESNGVIVTIMNGADFVIGCHSIMILKYGEEEVEYFNPNHRSDFFKVSRSKFDKYWAGNAIVVFSEPGTQASSDSLSIQPENKPIINGVEVTPVEEAMLKYLNAFRQRSGLHPLTVTQKLMDRARGHARWMANNNSMTHGPGIRENIAAGQWTARQVTDTWIASVGHNANMRTNEKYAGLGYFQARNGMIYWCQQFSN